MELKDFIASTLTQIIEGVCIAQKEAEKLDSMVNPYLVDHSKASHPLYFGSAVGIGRSHKPAFLLEFDIAIQEGQEKKNKSGMAIFVAPFGIGTQSGSTSSNVQQNRIKFVVPYSFPYQMGKKDSQ